MSSTQVKQSVVEARAKLQSHFKEYSDDNYGKGWESLWAKGDFLPWDKGAPNPALIDTLLERQDVVGNAMIEVNGKKRRKRALVPGCGRGVDILLLKSFGYEAVGLEYSETAVEACHKFEKEHGSEYRIYDADLGEGTAQFVVGDFFKDDWLVGIAGPEHKFDLIYDYTVSGNCQKICWIGSSNRVRSSSSAHCRPPFGPHGLNGWPNCSVLHHITILFASNSRHINHSQVVALPTARRLMHTWNI